MPLTRKTRKRRTFRKEGSLRNKSSPIMFVPIFLNMLNTVKLYHWKTTNYATHKATDDLYASLNDKLDNFVEVLLGKNDMGGRAKYLSSMPMQKLTIYSNNTDFSKQIDQYKTFLINLSDNALLSEKRNTDLLAIRDEILADLNKFLYLLTLTK
jgi:DNA-binding ferritin-like protein